MSFTEGETEIEREEVRGNEEETRVCACVVSYRNPSGWLPGCGHLSLTVFFQTDFMPDLAASCQIY